MSKNPAELWNYIKPELFVKDCSRYDNPLVFDYTNQSVTTVKLVPKVWMIAGLVVQKVYYKEFNVVENTYNTPLVHESWDWFLDPETRLAITRTINISCYQAHTETPELIEEFSTSRIKYYTTYAMQLQEIRKRRQNFIDQLENTILRNILPTVAKGDVRTAILITSSFMDRLHELTTRYVANGSVELLKELCKKEFRKTHSWMEQPYMDTTDKNLCFGDFLIQYFLQDPIEQLENVDRSYFLI